MKDKNPDKNASWRSKLEDLEPLPDGAFNKEAAWDKLHQHLHGNKGSKKYLWLWIAAACLFFIIMITWMNFPKSNPQLPEKEATTKPIEKNNITRSSANENNNTENRKIVLPVNANTITAIRKSPVINQPVIPREAIVEFHTPVPADTLKKTEPVIQILQTMNTNSIIAMTMPLVKKLKVVHINELGDPVTETLDMARNNDTKTFFIRFANGEVLAGPPVASATTGISILKIKPF